MVTESSAWGQGAAVALLLPGGALHSEQPPLLRQSTPVLWFCPSEDLLKVTKHGRSPNENSIKSLQCHENIAIV